MIRRCSAILICLIVSAIVLLPGLPAGARDQVSVVLDGRFLAFDVPPANVDGRTLVPMRIIFEALEAEVYWDSESGTVTAVKDDVIIKVAIGDTHINVDGILTAMGVAPVILDGRTLVPVRFISEALGCGVRWDGDTQTVFVDSNVDLCSHDYEDDGYCKICGADFLTKGSVSTDHNGKYVGVYEDNPVLDRPYRLYSYSTTIDEGEEVTVYGSMENHLGALWYKVSPTADKWVLSTNLRKIVTHYAVIYNANGGIDTPTSQYKTEYTDLILSSTKPTRNGYSFEGWGTSVDTNTVSYKAGDVYKNNSGIKLYAVWKRQQEPDIVVSAGINKTVGTVNDRYNYTVITNVPATKVTFRFDGSAAEYVINANSSFELRTGAGIVSPDKKTWTWINDTLTAGNRTVTITAYGANEKTSSISLQVTVTGDSILGTANIRYNASGGETAPPGHSTAKDSKGIARFNLTTIKPIREGYTFSGWLYENNVRFDLCQSGELVTFDTGSSAGNTNLTYFAVWAEIAKPVEAPPVAPLEDPPVIPPDTPVTPPEVPPVTTPDIPPVTPPDTPPVTPPVAPVLKVNSMRTNWNIAYTQVIGKGYYEVTSTFTCAANAVCDQPITEYGFILMDSGKRQIAESKRPVSSGGALIDDNFEICSTTSYIEDKLNPPAFPTPIPSPVHKKILADLTDGSTYYWYIYVVSNSQRIETESQSFVFHMN